MTRRRSPRRCRFPRLSAESATRINRIDNKYHCKLGVSTLDSCPMREFFQKFNAWNQKTGPMAAITANILMTLGITWFSLHFRLSAVPLTGRFWFALGGSAAAGPVTFIGIGLGRVLWNLLFLTVSAWVVHAAARKLGGKGTLK